MDFELLTAELLSRFVEIPTGEVDVAIGTSQQRVCELLGLDLSSLWQLVPGSKRYLAPTHIYRTVAGRPLPERIDAEEMFPWAHREMLANRPFTYSCVEGYPPEGARDREAIKRLGIKAAVRLPLSTGGGPVLGALTFGSLTTNREWPADMVRRLRLVAQIFAGALGRKAAERALRESQERLQMAAEAAGAGLWRLDLATREYWVTDEARRHFGFPENGPFTFDQVLAAVVPEDRDRVLKALSRACDGRREEIVEYRLRKPGGDERWLSSRGSVRLGPSGEPQSLMGVTVDVTERKRAEAALRDLSQRLIRAHEEERALLARELQGDLTQRLALLAIEVGQVEMAAPGGPHAPTLRSVRDGLVGLSEDVLSLAQQLHSSVLEVLGLAEALRAECDRFRRQGRVDVALELESTNVAVGDDPELCLLRIAQEALRNVERHSRAGVVAVSLQSRDGGLRLTVRDDGVGFDPAVQRGGRSLGLASMGERVQLVGGTLLVESAPGEGTAIVAWVPAEGPRCR